MPSFTRSQLPDAIRRRRQVVRSVWDHKKTVRAFLREHAPLEYTKSRFCSLEYTTHEDLTAPGRWKLAPIACHQVPWCIICTQRQDRTRTRLHMNRFSLCTPAGQEIRSRHHVQTAPLTTDGEGWGREARRDITAFMGLVWAVCVEHYGDGIGGLLSFHDIGEAAFVKPHPHIDFTLNGFRVLDGVASKVPIYDTSNGGYDRWQASLVALVAERWPGAWPGTLHINRLGIGVKKLEGSLSYQTRTILDFRKMEYNAERQLVAWNNYQDGSWTYMPVIQFLAGIAETESRLGDFNEAGRTMLHRGFGHMADRTFHRTAELVGGTELPHLEDCTCIEHGDWEERMLRDVQREVGAAKPLDWNEEPDQNDRGIDFEPLRL